MRNVNKMKIIPLAALFFVYCITFSVAYSTPVEPSDGDDKIDQLYSILQPKQEMRSGHFPLQYSLSHHGRVGPNRHGDITKELMLMGSSEMTKGGLSTLAATLHSVREAKFQEKTPVSKFLTHILSYKQENVPRAIIKSTHIPTMVQTLLRCLLFNFQSLDIFGKSDDDFVSSGFGKLVRDFITFFPDGNIKQAGLIGIFKSLIVSISSFLNQFDNTEWTGESRDILKKLISITVKELDNTMGNHKNFLVDVARLLNKYKEVRNFPSDLPKFLSIPPFDIDQLIEFSSEGLSRKEMYIIINQILIHLRNIIDDDGYKCFTDLYQELFHIRFSHLPGGAK